MSAGARIRVTVRRLVDCLIAAVAIDHGVAVLHSARDFDARGRISAGLVAD